MVRDFESYKKWFDWHKDLELKEFERLKEKAILDANNQIKESVTENDLKSAKGNLRVAEKMKFQFDKSKLIQYGNCTLFKKQVSFIPYTCQIETQDCFKHRRLD
jgi:hypothetical protein